jgi:hypothetical protein
MEEWAALALLPTIVDRDARQQARVWGSGSCLPGLVLLGESLHPILELWPEVPDQTLDGGGGTL